MRQIKEIMRLRYEMKLSQQAVADATGIARSTVKDYLLRARAANLTWPLPEAITNEQLNEALFPPDANKSPYHRATPDWQIIHKALKRKAITLQLLWEEYKKEHPSGYQYSWFACLYREWAKKRDVWMPQVHKAGEKTFVDYSGLTVPIWSTNLQTISFQAEIFVSVLGASDLLFCLATPTQKVADWIEAHNKMFHYYGGATELVIPDNLRTGVTRAHRYEPQCQTTFEELAQHYHCAIMPTRAYHPRDKAKVEKAVQLVQQRVLAPLRDQRFCSVTQLNEALAKQLDELNNRYSKAFGCTRRELFNEIEQSTLQPLPTVPYELAQWQQQQVNGGYHVQVEEHYYSVPYHYVRKKVDIRITKNSVEVFYQDERIACHVRDDARRAYTTVNAHRPEAHQQQAQWDNQRLQAWANGIGPFTQQFIQQLLQDIKRHLHQKERSALGILRLSHAYGEDKLEQACEKALEIGTYRYDSLTSILKRQQLVADQSTSEQSYQTPVHDNVRGSKYYH